MNAGYDRHVIARGLDLTRRYSLEEISQEVGIPPSYLHTLLVERRDDFGDSLISQLARAAGTTVSRIIRAGR